MSDTTPETTVDSILISALAPLGYPVKRLFHKGKEPVFITFQIVYAPEVNHADDDSDTTEYLYRVDIYSKRDYMALLRRVKRALKGAGFYGPVIDSENFESDTGYFHIPIEIKYLEEDEDGNSGIA